MKRSSIWGLVLALAPVSLAGTAPFCRNVRMEIDTIDIGEALRRLEAKLWYLGNHAMTSIHPHVRCQVGRVSRTPDGAPSKCMNDFSVPFGNRFDYFSEKDSWNVFHKAEVPEQSMFDIDRENGVMRISPPWTLETNDPHGRSELQCWIHPRYGYRYRVGVFRVSLGDVGDAQRTTVDVRGVLEKRFGLDTRGDGLKHMYARWQQRRHEKRYGKAAVSPEVAFVKEAKITGPTIDYLVGDVVGKVSLKLTCVEKGVDPTARSRAEIMRRAAVGGAAAGGLAMGAGRRVKSFTSHGSCPMVFAHRALVDPATGTENSITAMETSRDLGLDGVEIDVFSTEWGLVVTHDSNLKRQYAVDNKVVDIIDGGHRDRLQEIIGCPMFPQLSDFLKSARDAKMLVDIELKPEAPSVNPLSDYAERLGRGVGEMVRSLGLESTVVVSAIDSAKLEHVNDGAPEGRKIRVGIAQHSGIAAQALYMSESLRRNLGEADPRASVAQYKYVDSEWVQKAKSQGHITGTYTLYDLTEMSYEPNAPPQIAPSKGSFDKEIIKRVVQSGVDWIESDDPIQVIKDINRYCAGAGAVESLGGGEESASTLTSATNDVADGRSTVEEAVGALGEREDKRVSIDAEKEAQAEEK